jgi:hypothetical protein
VLCLLVGGCENPLERWAHRVLSAKLAQLGTANKEGHKMASKNKKLKKGKKLKETKSLATMVEYAP